MVVLTRSGNWLNIKSRSEKAINLYFLGDYIDRGYKSRQVIDYIIGLQDKEL